MMAVESDLAKRLVRVRYVGFVNAAHFQVRTPEFDALVAAMGPGFTLITDLTELEEMDLECVTELTQLMDRCLAAGVGNVLRVIPDPAKDIGFHILSLTHYRGRVPTTTFRSRAEAETALQQPAN